MHLVIGLGNPGSKYVGTRHNVGFAVVDALAARWACTFRRGVLRHRNALVATCTRNDATLVLAKPTTYMNESGRAVAELVRRYFKKQAPNDIAVTQLVVIHDDLDLPIGRLRIAVGGSSGGHRGVQSILSHWSHDFTRVRLGIGPNETPDGHRIPAELFVLKQFGKTERPQMDTAIIHTADAVEVLIRDGIDAAKRYVASSSSKSSP